MFPSKVDTQYCKRENGRVYQGDILRDMLLLEMEYVDEEGSGYSIIEKKVPYIIVLTQDCDLEQDFNNRAQISEKHDKYIDSILVCPAYLAEEFRKGKHLENFGLSMEMWNSKRYDQIKKQNNYRYHYLEGYQPYQIPNLVIDFKHYYTIPRNVIYFAKKNGHYLASLRELFRENLSHRFSYFLSRIGLPTVVENKVNKHSKIVKT